MRCIQPAMGGHFLVLVRFPIVGQLIEINELFGGDVGRGLWARAIFAPLINGGTRWGARAATLAETDNVQVGDFGSCPRAGAPCVYICTHVPSDPARTGTHTSTPKASPS